MAKKYYKGRMYYDGLAMLSGFSTDWKNFKYASMIQTCFDIFDEKCYIVDDTKFDVMYRGRHFIANYETEYNEDFTLPFKITMELCCPKCGEVVGELLCEGGVPVTEIFIEDEDYHNEWCFGDLSWTMKRLDENTIEVSCQ